MTLGESSHTLDTLPFALDQESRELFARAGETAIVQRVETEYMGIAERINGFASGLSPNEFEAHLAFRPPDGAIREVIATPDILGDYPETAGEAYGQLYSSGRQKGDLTECVSLITALEDPVLATWLNEAIHRQYIKHLINWRKVDDTRRGGVDYAKGDIYDVAAMGPEYRLALRMQDSAARDHNTAIDMTRAAFAACSKRDPRIARTVKKIAASPTVPERLFVAALRERAAAEVEADPEIVSSPPQQVSIGGIRKLLRGRR